VAADLENYYEIKFRQPKKKRAQHTITGGTYLIFKEAIF
jgi:hypothetical protein